MAMQRRPRAVPWLRDLVLRRRHDREIDRLADVMSCSVDGENRRSNFGCMNRLGGIYRYFIGGSGVPSGRRELRIVFEPFSKSLRRSCVAAAAFRRAGLATKL